MAKEGVTEFWHLIDGSFPLDLCRNRLVKKALDLGATHVLFFDVDMTYPRDFITRILSTGADCVGPLYFKKSEPFAPVAGIKDVPNDPQLIRPLSYARFEEGEFKGFRRELIEVDVIGCGGMLVSRRVLEAIGENWFEYERYKKTGEMSVTEDVPFCRKVKENGFKVYCHTGIVCGHLMTLPVSGKSWEDTIERSSVKG